MTDSLTITTVLTHYGADLTRIHGEGWKPVKCPFHHDRQASASVSTGKNAFKCHACGVKGTAISLLMEREGLDYDGAVGYANDILGQSVGRVRRAAPEKPRPVSRLRDRLFG